MPCIFFTKNTCKINTSYPGEKQIVRAFKKKADKKKVPKKN